MKRIVHSRLFHDRRVRYLIAGGSSFMLEFSLFVGILQVTGWLLWASTISFMAALLLSFLLHKHWSFSGDHVIRTTHQFAGYATLGVANLGAGNVLVWTFVYLHLAPALAKILTMVAIACWNFLILNRIVFRARP